MFRRLIWLCLSFIACTSEPDDAPRGDPLPEECSACLSAEDAGGCGAEERGCSANESCDAVMLCALQFECWSSHAGADCMNHYGCAEPESAAAPLFDAIETCARTQCADVCQYGAP